MYVMTPATTCSPDFEAIAAYIDGGLEPSARIELEKHLGSCDHCSELLAESYAVLREAEERERPQSGNGLDVAAKTLDFSSRHKDVPRPQEPLAARRSAWLAAAAILAAVGLGSWWTLANLDDGVDTSEELVAFLPESSLLREQLPDGWIDGRWSPTRGNAVVHAPPKAAFQLGVRSVDLAVALRAGDLRTAGFVTSSLRLLTDSLPDADSLLLTSLLLEQSLLAAEPSPDAASAWARRFDQELELIEPARYVDAGRWAITSHLAATTASGRYFNSNAWERGLQLLENSASDSKLYEIAAQLRGINSTDYDAMQPLIEEVMRLLGNGRASL